MSWRKPAQPPRALRRQPKSAAPMLAPRRCSALQSFPPWNSATSVGALHNMGPVWRGHITAPRFSVPRDPLPRDQRRSASPGEEEKKQQAAISASAWGGEMPWGGQGRDGELQHAAARGRQCRRRNGWESPFSGASANVCDVQSQAGTYALSRMYRPSLNLLLIPPPGLS